MRTRWSFLRCPRNPRQIRSRGRRRGHRKAAVLVEFALLLPLLILIVLGCIDFGRFAYMFIAVTNGARAGAEYAVMRPVTPASQPFWQAGVEDAVHDEMSGNRGYEQADLVVPSVTLTSDPLNLKRVRVRVQHPFETLVNWPGIPHQITLTRDVEMRVLR